MKFVSLLLCTVFADQIIKYYFVSQNPSVSLGGLDLMLFKNTGSAFELTVPNTVSICMSLVVLVLLGATLVKSKSQYLTMAITLIIGGGISNLIDRVIRGYVVDIIGIGLIEMNVADFYVFIGVSIALLNFFLSKSDIYESKSTNN